MRKDYIVLAVVILLDYMSFRRSLLLLGRRKLSLWLLWLVFGNFGRIVVGNARFVGWQDVGTFGDFGVIVGTAGARIFRRIIGAA